jgi:sugar O-acyltransferase (sialic acid O-acetyltransferase NeuD family)
MKKLAILGASGHGKVVADLALTCGWSAVSFFDDAWPDIVRNGAWDVVGDSGSLIKNISDYAGVIVAIGECTIRLAKQTQLAQENGRLVTIIHPTASISPYATIGAGVVIMAGVVISVDTSIGDASIINSGAIVEHDCVLGNAVHIAPGAVLSGNVTVGDRSWIGVGAIARQGARIGAGVTVGAGAVVLDQVRDGLTVVGCPAIPYSKK